MDPVPVDPAPVPAVRDRVLGTEVLVAGLPPAAAAAVLETLHRVEALFSRFRPDSDLSRVSAGAGAPVPVDPLVAAAVAEACAHARATGGVFSPLLGREVAATGYDTDIAAVPGRPSAPPPPPAGPGAVRVDHDAGTVAVPAGSALDLGGFVKGWALQRIAGELRRGGVGSGLLDAGGDLVAWGGPWRVGIAHPAAGAAAEVLEPRGPAAVATSSTTRRAWRDAAGRPRHHVVDPRTGAPARSPWQQATVVLTGPDADLGAAEVEATCLLVLGPGAGPAGLAARRPAARWWAVDHAGRVVRGGPG